MFFDDYVLSYEVQALKQGPEIYQEAIRSAGGQEESCIFKKDMEENIKGASA